MKALRPQFIAALVVGSLLAAFPAHSQEDGDEEAQEEAAPAPEVPAARPLRPAGRPFRPGQRAPAPAVQDSDSGSAPASGGSIPEGGQTLGGQGIQTGAQDGSAGGSSGGFRPMTGFSQGGIAPGGAAGDFKIVDLDKLPSASGSGHKRINLKGAKGLAVRFNTKGYRGKSFKFITSTFLGGQASDVVFEAAVSRAPGDIKATEACRIKGVAQDGAGQTRARSEIMVAIDPGPGGMSGGTEREIQAWRTAEGYVRKGRACLLEPQTQYYYNIIGECDYASIAHQDSMGWENKGPQNGCPITLVNNGITMLAPGTPPEEAARSSAPRGPRYAGLSASEEQEYQKWLASLPQNVRNVYQSGDSRYIWWKTFGSGKTP